MNSNEPPIWYSVIGENIERAGDRMRETERKRGVSDERTPVMQSIRITNIESSHHIANH